MWKVASDASGNGYSLHVQDKRGRVIASIGSHDLRMAGVGDQFLVTDIEEIKQIARLIALAPEMRAALEAITREGNPATATQDWPTPEAFADWAIEQARAALAGEERSE